MKLILALFAAVSSTALAGSLWNEAVTNERGMFADKRARRIGDIVTIIVQENTVASTSLELKTSRESKGGGDNILTNLVNQFIKVLPGTVSNTKIAKELEKKGFPTNPELPEAKSVFSSEYTGGGDITNRQTMTARAAVTVIDVLPNGNMVVEGVRVVRFGGETQYASLRGVVRPVDLTKENTVLSSNIADAQVEFVTEGSLTEAQKKGWLARLNAKVKPF